MTNPAFWLQRKGTSKNRSEQFESKADEAQEPECTEVHEDSEHRPTQQSSCAAGFSRYLKGCCHGGLGQVRALPLW